MTFSQNVKSEILRSVRNVGRCCATSFLAAVLKSIGSLTLGRGEYAFSVESDNVDFLKLCATIARDRLDVNSRISTYNMSAKGTAVYSCTFDAKLGEKLGLTVRDASGILSLVDVRSIMPAEPCCKKAFLQGLFVSCGSVVIPSSEDMSAIEKVKYHLELRFSDGEFAQAVANCYAAAEFKTTLRKNLTVLYIKDSERISDLLVYLNATNAKLELENVMVFRSVRNDVNRQNNCDVANIEKTIAAASRQLKAIAVCRESGRFEQLPDSLKEIALLRESNPEATLDEIAAKLKISKSGANHRFAKLMEIAFK